MVVDDALAHAEPCGHCVRMDTGYLGCEGEWFTPRQYARQSQKARAIFGTRLSAFHAVYLGDRRLLCHIAERNRNMDAEFFVHGMHWSLVGLAIAKGDPGMLRLLLWLGASPNKTIGHRRFSPSPLHYAVYYDRPVCVVHLLAAGADPRIPNRHGVFPIDVTPKPGMPGAAKEMLELLWL